MCFYGVYQDFLDEKGVKNKFLRSQIQILNFQPRWWPEYQPIDDELSTNIDNVSFIFFKKIIKHANNISSTLKKSQTHEPCFLSIRPDVCAHI